MPVCRIASTAVISPAFQWAMTSSQLYGFCAFGRPKRLPLAFAAAIPSACRWRIVSRSCCAIEDRTSTRMLFTMSSTHSCPAGYSISVVGKSSTFKRIPFSLKNCNSFFISVLLRLRRSRDLDNQCIPTPQQSGFKGCVSRPV